MKHTTRHISLILIITAVFISGSVIAQNNALQQSSKLSITNIVKPCGTYTKPGMLVQALSIISNDKDCITTMSKGSDVHFTARNKIILLPGFTAYNGSKFLADIKPLMPDNKGIQLAADDEMLHKDVTVLPNPFKTSFIILVNAAEDCKAQVMLHNSVGIKAKEQVNINLSEGMNKIVFNASDLASGLYVLEVNFGNSRVVKKIVKSE